MALMDKPEEPTTKIKTQIENGIRLAKCRKCGCMKEALESMKHALLTSDKTKTYPDLLENTDQWLKQMEAIKYSCLGCEYCFPAVATNIFNEVFSQPSTETKRLSCGFEEDRYKTWFPVPGEYFAFCEGSSCPVAVSTLASVELAEALANNRPKELCIVGKTETENIGIDKIVKNVISNPTIQILLLSGKEPKGHLSGNTLLALWKNGVDENMKIIGSKARRPFLNNVSREQVVSFRNQIRIVDMIGDEDVESVTKRIRQVSLDTITERSDAEYDACMKQISTSDIPQLVHASGPQKVEQDKAGYFVIISQPRIGIISVEHYSYDNKHLRTIEGKDARAIYWTIIENLWVSQLSHAAYLGKELMKAELSMKLGFKYIQDGV